MERFSLLKMLAKVFCGLTTVFLAKNNLIVFRGFFNLINLIRNYARI